MKTPLMLAVLFTAIFPKGTFAVGLTPPSDAAIADCISNELPVPFTPEEVATPPAGEIRKKYLREVNRCRSKLGAVLASVAPGSEGQQSPLFAKFQTIKMGLDQLASSRLESHLFGAIPTMAEVFEVDAASSPRFVSDSNGWLHNLSAPMLYIVAEHIARQNGNVAAGNLASFVKLFSGTRGFIFQGDWEDHPQPVDAGAVMILDAASVVTQLKTEPWQRASQFLGGADQASSFFSSYASNGDGVAVLKTKYAQNQTAIDAKFVELKNWVEQQEAAVASP